MSKVIRKLFWIWNCDEEEQWLNEMVSKGLTPISVSFCRYEFEECTRGEYLVRADYIDRNYKHIKSREYIETVKGTGAEVIAMRGQTVYFRKKTELDDGSFFDSTSRLKKYNFILNQSGWIIATMCLLFISSVLRYITEYTEPFRTFDLILAILCGGFAVFGIKGHMKIRKKQKILNKL